MKIYSLYNKVTNDTRKIYSKQKYGDIKSLNHFANLLNKLIVSKNLITNGTVLFVGVKYPYSDKYKKNFVILTEKISLLTKLPTVYAFYRYQYNFETFYDNHIKRKAAVPKLSQKDKRKYKDYSFIIIEDVIITGTTLKVIEKSLLNTSKRLSVVSIFDLRGKQVVEKDINNYFFDIHGIDGLVRLLNSKNYIPTTQLLRTLDVLKRKDLKLLLQRIIKSKELKESYKSYTGKVLI